jgi:hypothetical protein
MLTSRRFIIAIVALTMLFILGFYGYEAVAQSIAAVSLGLAGANAFESLKKRPSSVKESKK